MVSLDEMTLQAKWVLMDGVYVLEGGWGKIWYKIAVGRDRGGSSQNIGVGLGIGGGESGKE